MAFKSPAQGWNHALPRGHPTMGYPTGVLGCHTQQSTEMPTTAAFEICPPAQSPGKFELTSILEAVGCCISRKAKLCSPPPAQCQKHSVPSLLCTGASRPSQATGAIFPTHQLYICKSTAVQQHLQIDESNLSRFCLSNVHRFSFSKVQKCAVCASAANHNQPYFEEQVTLAENTLELKFKVLLKSIGSRHRKRMHHTLLRVEVNKLLFKLMQLFCANDLSVQQVQRNFQIITSNVNHGLVVFSGFDCNRLLPPCDYWPKKTSRVRTNECKGPPKSSSAILCTGPARITSSPTSSSVGCIQCSKGMHDATLCVKSLAHIMDYSHNVS